MLPRVIVDSRVSKHATKADPFVFFITSIVVKLSGTSNCVSSRRVMCTDNVWRAY